MTNLASLTAATPPIRRYLAVRGLPGSGRGGALCSTQVPAQPGVGPHALGRFCSALAVVTSRSGSMVDGRGIMFPAGGGDCPIGDILNLFVGLLVLFGQIADLGRL